MEETRIIDNDDGCVDGPQALPAGTELLGGKFAVTRLVGSGGFGITYLAQDNYLERAVVIKECFPDAFCFRFGTCVSVTAQRFDAQFRKTVEMFMREARSIAKLRHPNVVTAHQVFEENETAYMVLDLIEGRDLADIIEREDQHLKPVQVHEILVKVLDAIGVVHRHDLLHRDISPDNILLDKWGSPALIDFGAAREDASRKNDVVSTMLVVKDGYSPHEFYISGTVHEPSSDLYALGATMYHLISGDAPVDSQSRVAALTNNETDPCEPLAGRFPQYDLAFLEAIDKAMRVPPKDRIQSAAQWLALIEQEEDEKVQVVSLPTEPNLIKTLSEMIQETNKHVLSTPLVLSQDAQEPTERKPPVSHDAPFSPEWIAEFNRETHERATQGRAARKAPHCAASSVINKDVSLQGDDAIPPQDAGQGAASRNILDWVPFSKSR